MIRVPFFLLVDFSKGGRQNKKGKRALLRDPDSRAGAQRFVHV